jgi:hypothetical protein
MEAEIDQSPEIVSAGVDDHNDWAASFSEHPHLYREGDDRRVYPLALYLDGIKFTRSIGPGRADSLIAVTAYNLKSLRRHLVAVVSKRESCGHDTLWPVLNHIRWSLEAATMGRRPTERWDGSAWPKESKYFETQGSDMKSRFLLCQVKADWAEQCSALGFPTWSSFHSPCFLCDCTKKTMYRFEDVSLENSSWNAKPNTYDEECAKHEVRVLVATESDRLKILTEGGLYSKKAKSKIFGRVLRHDIPSLGLLANDRLEPSREIQHLSLFDSQPLPFYATFWRVRYDARNRSIGWVNRRCPLFCEALGTTPSSVLHLDTLHCVYLGVFSTFTYYAIREILDSDFYRIGGAKDVREPESLARLLNDFSKSCRYGRPRAAPRKTETQTGETNPSRTFWLKYLRVNSERMVQAHVLPTCKIDTYRTHPSRRTQHSPTICENLERLKPLARRHPPDRPSHTN